ncbi:MAG: single-stranded-DNA-specific exonuclease RecJ [Chloroflexi bacterium]|nr:single-stranded-DNA-specific exonuclease RecJ [Chloroflexota bacterium]
MGVLEGQQRRWRVAPETSPSAIAALSHLPPLIAHLLVRRGITTADQANEFMEAADSLFEDPRTLPDVDRATARIKAARDRGETVAVYGDFDADGVTGTALMVKAFRHYGLNVISYIPHRVREGHGLNVGAVDSLREQGVKLIVTVDCGVTDIAAIQHASDHGIDTVVTDHHLVAENLPNAAAIINPHAEHSRYAFDHLTGVGMTLKLSQALLEPEFGERWTEGLMELAAIGTITDMAPLLGENRYIVHRGLKHLAKTSSTGLLALLRAARTELAHVTAETIGFTIGPRLNAAGRLDHADIALDLLTTNDRARAETLVVELDGYNAQRRELTESTQAIARQQLPAQIPPLIAVGSPEFNPGVVGLVAGKLAEEFGAPALCYAQDGDTIMASCRSTPGFHWADALTACEDLLLRHGGHAQAAGFACKAGDLPVLIERLQAIAAEQLGGSPKVVDGVVDAEVQLAELMGPTFQALRKMEPFGIGNPSPLFLTRGAEVRDARTMGAARNHFRLTLVAGGATWDAVGFRQEWIDGTRYVDIVYTLDIDHWNGSPRLRLTLRDYAPSAQPRLAL